jgi:hypothetical protein
MRKSFFVIIAAIGVFAISCKKNTEEPAAPVTKADYFQLKVGNYWIYQDFRIDTSGVETLKPELDSAYIEKDTMINGYTYFKLHEKSYGLAPMTIFLRDSSGYLVNSYGFIYASDFNFTDTLYVNNTKPDWFMGYVTMVGKDSLVTVPAGTFQSITTSQKVIPTPPNTANHPIRYSYEIFGKGVGKMKSHAFLWSGGMSYEARLLRYKVQ